jgi:hypothetical protein
VYQKQTKTSAGYERLLRLGKILRVIKVIRLLKGVKAVE